MKTASSILVFCVAALLALGMVMLYSCSIAGFGTRYHIMQLIWCGVGLVACTCAAAVDYRILRKAAWPIYIVTIGLLIAVLIPHVGILVKGARRWLGYGPARFQPSEVAKLALIIVLAWYSERYQRHMTSFVRGIIRPGVFIGLILALVFLEPDRGTTVLLGAVSGTILLMAGVRWLYFAPPVLAGLLALGFSIYRDPVRIKRVFGWLYLEENKSGVSYQGWQALLAFGTGGWTGRGLGSGLQKTFVPEGHTDFILSTIGEELGVVATLSVVAAFLIILICGLRIACKASEPFGFFLGAGISFLIGLQAFINIAVVTSTLPNKGLPLPFISYGGSSLVIMLTCVGILLSIARHSSAAEESAKQGSEPEVFDSNNPFARKPVTSPAEA